ncbi:MAG: hypothetical protein HGA81_05680 [Chlorobium limicola]|nr:hypothetical protein [Chlorobium limicola]NTV20383.1 hypothetical protein [Chlorobium limicola]
MSGRKKSTSSTLPGFAANAALALIAVTCVFPDRQIQPLAQSFETGGGFTEYLYRVRSSHRGNQ